MMISKKYYLSLLAIVFLKTINVKGQKDIKSSLTFVIDDTGSMWNDIEQVKMGVNDIFDAVLKSNDSQIENFVLVTFNDPDVKTRTVTKDRHVFKDALNDIDVFGGGDCPEYSMTGIEKALEVSLPGSNLYVCTDASASDYKRYKHVSALAQSKGSQVTFLLTGRCDSVSDDSPGYKEYYDLSRNTNGQVFHLGKTDIRDIIDYVIKNVKGRRTPLARGEFPAGEHKLNFTVDHKTTDIIIAASGKEPKVDVTDPDGIKSPLEKVLEKENIGIYGTNASKPGVHTVTIESKSESSVLVTGKTKLNFRYGFSTFRPTSVDDAATRPPSDVKSYLSIQLIEADGVDLKMIKFKDSDGYDINDEIPFTVIDEKRKLYLTDLIYPPKDMFKISIMCYDSGSGSYLIRVSPTLIEPSKVLDPPKPTPPKVTIDGEPKIVAEFDEPLNLKCKIHAYPKPSVLWKVKESSEIINSTLSVKELPYEYISIADIAKVNKNETYKCIVENEFDKVEKYVVVETINKYYFKVLEQPTDTVIEYEKSDKFICNVNAFPSADIIWFKNGIEINNFDEEDLEVSTDNTTLTVKSMQPDLIGNYMCEARNKFERKLFYFKLGISGIESPKVNKRINRIYASKGSTVDINCTIIAGKPKPTITWYFRNKLGKFQKFVKDVINIKNVDIKNAGIYKCVASNLKGIDFHETELLIEYPATIKGSTKNVTARDGEKVILPCNVDGVPRPSVRWFKDGAIITSSRTVNIYRNHTLKFTASLEGTGNYTCTAENRYGSVNETTAVYVYVPVSIESPKESLLKVEVGSNLILPCRADGYPYPTIQWLFYNKDTKTPKVINSTDSSLQLLRLQLEDQGYYVCSASNAGGTANITYDVQVLAPPLIENIHPAKTFQAVKGDLTLRIPCKATGSPKPNITWMKNGLNIASGSEWYNIEGDGTLVIKNVDELSAGAYICEARNYLGFDQEVYEVVVDPYPRSDPAITTIMVEKGQSVLLKCDVPRKFLDSLRWYKAGRLIGKGEYELKNVTISDSGIYTCRVSDFIKSRTGNTMVIVGFKPHFQSYVDEEIPFEDETFAGLDCEAIAEPRPKVTWMYNEKPLNDTEMYKVVTMKLNNIGMYTCEVSNQFGKIVRNFKIKLSDCILDISKDFGGNQPLMYKSPLGWPNFDTSDGYTRIPKDEYISLFCPTSFQKFPKTYITAFCHGGTNFKVNGKANYKYEDLKCTDDIQSVIRNTRKACHRGKGQLIKVGYLAFGNLLEAYQVCFDKLTNIPIYTKHVMKRNLADVEPLDIIWHGREAVSFDLEALYDCDRQIDYFSRNIGKWFHREDKCCFSRRQLVNPKDMVPGLAQMATYSSLNIVPHWSSCSAKNWEAVEDRVRWLAKSTPYELTVYTGVFNTLKMKQSGNRTWNAHITDGGKGQQTVPQYLWKVIQDPMSGSSVAVIQVNVPDLKQSEANKYVICRDICNEIHWMRNPNWNDVTKGYTYCCTLKDFIRSFGFNYVFDETYSKILNDVDFLPKHSLT